MGSTESKWLVKSNDLINGPYEFNEVVESIFKGDVHLLDEIKGYLESNSKTNQKGLVEQEKVNTYEINEIKNQHK